MKLTTKSRCAIAGMIDLALLSAESNEEDDSRSVTLVEISKRQDISLSYLEQLFQKMRRAGLVTSSRGRNGGYKLSRSPSLISMADIIEASGDRLDATNCGGKGDCKAGRPCLMHHLWTGLNTTIHEHLRSITIQQVMDMNERAALDEDGGVSAETSRPVVREPDALAILDSLAASGPRRGRDGRKDRDVPNDSNHPVDSNDPDVALGSTDPIDRADRPDRAERNEPRDADDPDGVRDDRNARNARAMTIAIDLVMRQLMGQPRGAARGTIGEDSSKGRPSFDSVADESDDVPPKRTN